MSPGADGGVHPDDLAHPAFDHLREGLARAEELRLAEDAERLLSVAELRSSLDAEAAAEAELAKLRLQVEADALRGAYGLEALDFGPQREPGDLFTRNDIVILPEERLELEVRRPETGDELRERIYDAFDIPMSMRQWRDILRAHPPRNLRQLLPSPANAVHRSRSWRRPVSVRIALSRARLERRR